MSSAINSSKPFVTIPSKALNISLSSVKNRQAVQEAEMLAAPSLPSAGSLGAVPSAGGSSRFVYIDALRGLAASYVLVYHFYGYLSKGHTVERLPHVLHVFLANGWLGVEIFFVLSGFVISYSVRKARITPKFIGKFALRRSLRLDPPYWVTITLTYLMIRLTQGYMGTSLGLSEWKVFAANIFYLDNVLGIPSIVKVGWTLCLEVQFYLAYVLLIAVLQQFSKVLSVGKARLLVFIPLAVYSLALAVHLVNFQYEGFFFGSWYMFFLGVVASWLITGGIRLRWAYAYIGLTLLSLTLTWDPRTLVSAATALSIIMVARAGHLRNALNWRWAQYLGRISYSLYLVHPLVGHRILGLAIRRFGAIPSARVSLVLFLFATAASITAAHIMHALIERPSMMLSKRIVLRSEPKYAPGKNRDAIEGQLPSAIHPEQL